MSKARNHLIQRFAELERAVREVRLVTPNGSTPHADPEPFYTWASSAMNAIAAAFGSDSPHATNFQREFCKISSNYVDRRQLEGMRGIFLGAKNDVDGGYVFRLEQTVTGEVFGDFVVAAKTALSEGNHTVAAVLACAALEDALKRHAAANGLVVDGLTMDEVVNALKSKGLVSGPQKSLLAAMPKIRNTAMHADWAKLKPEDAGSVIGFVEQFILVHFQ